MRPDQATVAISCVSFIKATEPRKQFDFQRRICCRHGEDLKKAGAMQVSCCWLWRLGVVYAGTTQAQPPLPSSAQSSPTLGNFNTPSTLDPRPSALVAVTLELPNDGLTLRPTELPSSRALSRSRIRVGPGLIGGFPCFGPAR